MLCYVYFTIKKEKSLLGEGKCKTEMKILIEWNRSLQKKTDTPFQQLKKVLRALRKDKEECNK